jgi:hypothetical protein
VVEVEVEPKFVSPLPRETCATFVCIWLPAVFLMIAVILNVNKWIYFVWRILSLSMQMKTIKDQIAAEEHVVNAEREKMKTKTRILNVLTILIIVFVCCFMISYFIYACDGTFENGKDF